MPVTMSAPDWAINQPVPATENPVSKQPNIMRRIRCQIPTTNNGPAQGFMSAFKQQDMDIPIKNYSSVPCSKALLPVINALLFQKHFKPAASRWPVTP
jgi:hypothetical protein